MIRMYIANMTGATFEMKLSEQNKYESANFDMCVSWFRASDVWYQFNQSDYKYLEYE